jgi:glycosyltransferase involved in cell wall biosynthesis
MQCAKSYVICLGRPEDGPLASLLAGHAECIWLGFRARYAPYYVWKLAGLLRRLRIDVVHSNLFEANLVSVLAATLARVPVIVTSEHGRNPWKSDAHRWVERAVISRLAQKRICVSREILEIRRDLDGIPESKLTHIPNGTEVDAGPRSSPGHTFVFGTIGRLVSAKDYGTLIKAMGRLRDKGYPVHLYIVGDGPERPALESAIAALSLDSVIDLTGFQSDTRAWLGRFHAFVLSSVREGQPMALLEAMASGLPIVATRVGAVPDTIEPGAEGLIVEPGDPVRLADAMETLVLDEQRCQQLGESARARCRREFSIQATCDRYLQVYDAVSRGEDQDDHGIHAER